MSGGSLEGRRLPGRLPQPTHRAPTGRVPRCHGRLVASRVRSRVEVHGIDRLDVEGSPQAHRSETLPHRRPVRECGGRGLTWSCSLWGSFPRALALFRPELAVGPRRGASRRASLLATVAEQAVSAQPRKTRAGHRHDVRRGSNVACATAPRWSAACRPAEQSREGMPDADRPRSPTDSPTEEDASGDRSATRRPRAARAAAPPDRSSAPRSSRRRSRRRPA